VAGAPGAAGCTASVESRAVWTVEERERLRGALLAAAGADRRIVAGALTGSASLGVEDRWSDVDLAFGVGVAGELQETLAGWTALMYERHQALHHVDMVVGPTTYRVFLLENGLQVDLAFTPAAEFGARGPAFRLLFGAATERTTPAPSAEQLIGMAWLYGLHARTSIVRGQLWQAEYMVSAVRDHVLALAALRHGLPTAYGRGIDRLPTAVTAPLGEGLVRSLDADELARALAVVMGGLMGEIRRTSPELSGRLERALAEIVATARD
jgi:hypothetical protein